MAKRILIVEDDQFLREFYQELFSDEGYSVESVGDGEAGLAKMQKGGYDVVMLDIMMPKIDGLEVLRELKTRRPEQENKAIVMLTNLGQDAIIKTAFELGAKGYLVKSAMNPDQVLTEIKSYL